MKKFFTLLIAILFLGGAIAQTNVQSNANDNWIAYMNVFDLPSNGSGYQFGSSWGVADAKTVIDNANNTITLQPNFNTYGDNPGDPYWIDQTTLEGNKWMEANTFVEPGSSVNGSDLTFYGDVLENTLDDEYTATFFVKALDPSSGFSDALAGNYIQDLPESGRFSVTVPGASLTTGLIVQYGFTITGANANPADEAAIGSVVIGIESAIDVQLACESFTWIDSNTYTSSTITPIDTIVNSLGGDSIVALDLTIESPFESSETITSCNSYEWLQNGITYDNSGVYIDSLTSAAGCDSVYILNLTINEVNTGASSNGPTITADQAGATYQWLDCDNGNAPIAGATEQSYTALISGSYAVEVTLNGCTETSECVTVLISSVNELGDSIEIQIFPIPAYDSFNVQMEEGTIFQAELRDMQGRLIQRTSFLGENRIQLDLLEDAGMYSLILETSLGRVVRKVMKQ